jgi:hypothetical protein
MVKWGKELKAPEDLCQTDGIAVTVNFDHIKRHYYITHRKITPTGIVPPWSRPGPDGIPRTRTAVVKSPRISFSFPLSN